MSARSRPSLSLPTPPAPRRSALGPYTEDCQKGEPDASMRQQKTSVLHGQYVHCADGAAASREPGYAAIRKRPWHTNLDTLSSARGTLLKASCEPAGAKNSWSSQASMIWSLLLTRKRRCAMRSRHAMLENQRFPKQIPRSLRLATKDEKARLGLFTSATETTIYPEVAGFLMFKYF